MPFLYHLAVTTEPAWWRVTRLGAAPPLVLQRLQQCDALAVVMAPSGDLVGAAALAEGSLVAATAVLDLQALPEPEAQAVVAALAPDIVRAGFEGAGLRRLYHDRFDGEPDLLGATSPHWAAEVRYPDHARIDGALRARTTYALGSDTFRAAFPPEEAS